MKYKVGTLIWDKDDNEWGMIIDYVDFSEEVFITAWTESPQQTFYHDQLKLTGDRFEFYEV